MFTPFEIARIARQVVFSPASVPSVRFQLVQSSNHGDSKADLLLLVRHVAAQTADEVTALVHGLSKEIDRLWTQKRPELVARLQEKEVAVVKCEANGQTSAKFEILKEIDSLKAELKALEQVIVKLRDVIGALERLLPVVIATVADAGSTGCSPSPAIVTTRIAAVLKCVPPIELAVAQCTGEVAATVRVWGAKFRILLSHLPRLFEPAF